MNEAKLHSFLIFKVGERAGEMARGLRAFHLVEDPDSVPSTYVLANFQSNNRK